MIEKKTPEKKQRKKLKPRKTKYGISCGVIIFNINKKKPEYLLVKYPTYWGFVRGKVEPGETEELTAFREALEETGLNDLAFIPGFREVASYYFRRGNEIIRKDDIYLLAKTSNWNVHISHEHENFRWCDYEKSLALMKIRTNREILTKAHWLIQTHMKIW